MSSEVEQILGRLTGLGVSVQVVNDKIRIRPAGTIPSDLAEKIREHKLEIIKRLRQTEHSEPGPFSDGENKVLGVPGPVYQELKKIVTTEMATALDLVYRIFPGDEAIHFEPDCQPLTPARQEDFEERAAIMEIDGGLPRAEAEARAMELIRGRAWA